MSSTQVLLDRIAALKQRLGQGETARSLTPTDPLQALGEKVARGAWQNALLDSSLKGKTPAEEMAGAAPRLTARAARLLQRGRDLLHDLRSLADEPLFQNRGDVLADQYHQTAAMLDTVLRAVRDFPDGAGAQMRLCDGLEAALGMVRDRIGVLKANLEYRRADEAKIETLADLLQQLVAGQALHLHAFLPLAETILEEARQNSPLKFYVGDPSRPARYIACHGLLTAEVLARLALREPEWAGRLNEPVLAGLLHDVGMLRVPVEILVQPSPLHDEQLRIVEQHARAGAEILGNMIPSKPWLVEAAGSHHERIDGTGYPGGLREPQLSPLVRMVSVCDVYAALCSPRPYRAARETRAGLADTLLLAEQGGLDRFQAERLLELSFYPVGSVVELADGAVGVVVGTHPARKDLHNPARPIVALLTDSQGQPLPFPCHLDLAQAEGRSILRTLSPAQRRELLSNRYPELV